MDAISRSIEQLLKSGDDSSRGHILNSLIKLQHKIETPYDTLHRLSGTGIEITAARIGADLSLFKQLKNSNKPLTITELSNATGASPLLLGRLLRYLASVDMIEETAQDTFAANSMTATLAMDGYQGAIYHLFDNVGPTLQHLPDFLAENKYKDITSGTDTPFQKAFNTDLPAFAWLPTQPKRFASVQQIMTVHQAGAAPWFTVYPLEKELKGLLSDEVLVDVGGGFGHQCIALIQAFPQLSGKLILQDLPQTIEMLPPLEGVQPIAHNFFEPQPIKGASFYYFRNVLHDWTDENCLRILRNIIPAMSINSKILIDEMVLPNTGASWQATQMDLTMMAAMAAQERTEEHWRVLLDTAGLKIVDIVTYVSLRQDSIIVAVPK